MTGVRNSLTRTESDAIGEVVSLESCHIVLETSPPDYVEKISRYLESCVGQKGQDEAPNGPADADSESGDSLFITQKPVPAAERSGRRRTYNSRSKPASPRDLEECEKDTSSSTSHDEEYKTDNNRRKMKKYKLPKYNFPFLSEQTLKFRRSMLPDKNKSLVNYMMGGFFKCVRELRLDPKSSLPTVDTDGEDISPLSEEDEDRSEVEDIKVVERKQFVETVSLSKAKRQETWSSPLKQQRKREARNAGQGTARGRQTKMLHKNTVKASISKAVPVSSVTQSSDDGESSCRALVQRERKDQHAISDGNFLAQTGKPKTRHRAHEDALHLQKVSEEDNESTVCEPRKLLQGQSPEKGREASTLVTEPQTDVCNETKEKKRKTKKKDKVNHESVEEGTGQSQEEPDNILTQQEGDVPDVKQKKKKREKDKSAAENVGQEVDGSVESDVRVEDSNMEDGSKEKRKKRKKSSEDVEQLQSSAVVEPLNGDTEIQKRKKKRKKEVMVVEREEEEASNMSQMSTERLEESGNCLENAAASQKTLDSGYVKRKKHKKKRQSSANDATQDGGEGVDASNCLDGSVTSTKGMSLKQRTKNSSRTPEENEKVDNNLEGFEDNEENAELVTKKKKKKKSEIFSRDVSEDKVAQSDDSVSVREKKKERASSFLVADAEENDGRVHGEAEKPAVSAGDVEELNDVVMKKKKKRKMSVAQDSVEKDHKWDFEEPLSETTDTGVKREKKQTGSESESVRERLEAHVGFPPTDEAVVLKKKKKKKCEDVQEGSPPASGDVESIILNTCSSVSHKIKGKHAEISHDSSATSDRASKETPNVVERASASSETPGNQVLNDTRDKKKKKKMKSTDTALLDGNSLMESAELESREIKKKEKKQRRNKQSTVPSTASETISTCKMLSSENIVENRHRKVKRRLHNANEDFLSDC